MRFDTCFPRVSPAIGRTAIVILLVALVLGLPQLASAISQFPIVTDQLGSFESPLVLPGCLNITLLIAGIFGGFRAGSHVAKPVVNRCGGGNELVG